MKKHSEIFPWEEFYLRYTTNFEEFCFNYHGYTIWLIKEFEGFSYTITKVEKETIIGPIYLTPELLIEKARFFGKTLYDLWDEIE